MKKSIRKLAQEALWKRFTKETGKDIDSKGYVKRVVDNLLPDVNLDMGLIFSYIILAKY